MFPERLGKEMVWIYNWLHLEILSENWLGAHSNGNS